MSTPQTLLQLGKTSWRRMLMLQESLQKLRMHTENPYSYPPNVNDPTTRENENKSENEITSHSSQVRMKMKCIHMKRLGEKINTLLCAPYVDNLKHTGSHTLQTSASRMKSIHKHQSTSHLYQRQTFGQQPCLQSPQPRTTPTELH